MAQGKETIGFVGLGLMGHGMAKNIVEKGYPLLVSAHRNRQPVDDLIKRGAQEAGSLKDMAARADAIVMCVTGSREVEAIVRGKGGLMEGLRRGAIVIDCSTAEPNSTVRLAAELAAIGVDLVDAPLSRTPKEAWEGTLDTMVGASEATFARVQPLLATFAAKIVRMGETGDGHRMKLLNNFISLGYAALYSEALALATKVGISPQRFDNVIRGGRMDCGFYQTFMGYTIGGNREAHKFTLANALKDLTYLESMADAAGLINPMGNAAKNTFATAVAAGAGGPADYVPHLPEHIGRANGIDLKPKAAPQSAPGGGGN
jgi:3-hydroxyisobutyrate dehydrogenase-like beta-hydroxyacid dehydrogenase